MAKVKRKVHWRGETGKPRHAVREVDGVHLPRAVCGVAVKESWSPIGTRTKKDDVKCSKCEVWEPAGRGPGGENYKPKTEKVPVAA